MIENKFIDLFETVQINVFYKREIKPIQPKQIVSLIKNCK
jgi:hypothetical protein